MNLQRLLLLLLLLLLNSKVCFCHAMRRNVCSSSLPFLAPVSHLFSGLLSSLSRSTCDLWVIQSICVYFALGWWDCGDVYVCFNGLKSAHFRFMVCLLFSSASLVCLALLCVLMAVAAALEASDVCYGNGNGNNHVVVAVPGRRSCFNPPVSREVLARPTSTAHIPALLSSCCTCFRWRRFPPPHQQGFLLFSLTTSNLISPKPRLLLLLLEKSSFWQPLQNVRLLVPLV